MKNVLLLLMTSMLLSGCLARAPLLSDDLPNKLEALNAWNIQGRMGYRSDNDGGSASVTWQQRAREGRVLFSGPVGIGSAELNWNKRGATLSTSKNTLKAGSTEALADHLIGVPVSLESMTWWVRGLPSPLSPSRLSHSPEGQLLTLEQDGWRIEYGAYQTVHHWQLPHRIRVSDGNRNLNLVIRQWEPLPR